MENSHKIQQYSTSSKEAKPSRIDKTTHTIYLSKALKKELAMLAVEENISQQDLTIEALELLIQKYKQ